MRIRHLLLLGISVCLYTQANATKYVYISSAEELAAFRDAVNSNGKVTATDDATGKQSSILASSANVKITADIDLSTVCGENISTWTPIGKTQANPFNGSFDGDFHTITNLYMKENEPNLNSQGLFGFSSGTIMNLTLRGNISIRQYTGSFVGYLMENGSLINCINYCDVEATGFNIGGLCGECKSASACRIEHCINYGSIKGQKYVGGIVGKTSPGLLYCANFGEISGEEFVGGLIGNSGKIILNGCYNYGSAQGGPITGNNNISSKSIVAYNTEAISNEQPIVGNGFTRSDFASGAVAYLLNNGNDVWKQTLGADPYPVFEGGTVYQHTLASGTIYSNSAELDIVYHADGTQDELVWQTDSSFAPADNSFLVTTNAGINGHNVVLRNSDGTYTCKKFCLTDGEAFHSDIDFTVDTLTYNRAATASAIVTMVLPADIPTDYLKGNLYVFSDFDGTNVHFSSYEQETTEANKPYAIKPEDAQTTILENGARNVTIKAADEITEIAHNNLTCFGEYETASYNSDDHFSYIVFSGGKLKKYKKINLSPFRAGFRLGLDFNNTSGTLGLKLDNELSGVIVIENGEEELGKVNVFDIEGRLVRANAEPTTCFSGLAKGIYIVNGRKFDINPNTAGISAPNSLKKAAADTGFAE